MNLNVNSFIGMFWNTYPLSFLIGYVGEGEHKTCKQDPPHPYLKSNSVSLNCVFTVSSPSLKIINET